MKPFRVALTIVSWILLAPTWAAEVRTLSPIQRLESPDSSYYWYGQDVAIDGGNIIAIAAFNGGASALLYQRPGSTGSFVYRGVLHTVAQPVGSTVDVAMKNGIAVIRIGSEVAIFEYSNGNYVRARMDTPPPQGGGVAVSGHSILIGGDGCSYDALLYQKAANGSWNVAGRLDDHRGECQPDGMAVELNYDYAVVREPYDFLTTVFHRNGTAFEWLPVGDLTLAGGVSYQGPYALQGSTAVAPGRAVFTRTGNTWARTGELEPVDSPNLIGEGFHVVYRDGVLLASEGRISGGGGRPYAYLEISPGEFEHVAVLDTAEATVQNDISNRTAVVSVRSMTGPLHFGIDIFELPAPLRAPPPIVIDFEDRDLSGFTFHGDGLWGLARSGSDDVLKETLANGRTVGLLNDGDWSGYQRVEAEIAPDYSAGGWVGLITRFVDFENYYFVALRDNSTYGIYCRLNGVDNLLREGALAITGPARVGFVADGDNLSLIVNEQLVRSVTDGSLAHGRAALTTYLSRATFDDVHVASTREFLLLKRGFGPDGRWFGPSFRQYGTTGVWQVMVDANGNNIGLSQTNPSGGTLLVNGTPVANQEVTARMRLDAFNSANTGAWFGLLARFVDPQNYYYVAIRSNGQVQIRKQVNGVITVLAAANFAARAGQFHDVRFRVLGHTLRLIVDGVLVASADDGDIDEGQYGMGAHWAQATWEGVAVSQP